jgi:hypothetical protein
MLALGGPGFVGGMGVGRCARKPTFNPVDALGGDGRAVGVPSEHHRNRRSRRLRQGTFGASVSM